MVARQPSYTVSALYCPTGKRHEWHTNAWESAHRLAIALKETHGYGSDLSDWVDVQSKEDKAAPTAPAPEAA